MAAKSRPVERDPVLRAGQRVRALREARGLSLRDLAERSGVSAPMLSQVARGEPLPPPVSRQTLLVGTRMLAVLIDDERYDLSPGDAITFDADLPHHFENPGSTETTFTAAVTAGLRNPKG